jgi:methionyl-tRNA synthetase
MRSDRESFYISTTIPYVNGDPHLGHAQEYIESDCIARYQRLVGKDVFFLSGTDENSLKNVKAADNIGKDVAEFVSQNAEKFRKFKKSLNISIDDFIRTTEDRHKQGAKKLWKMCEEDIYKKNYKGLYCVGCEMFYKEEELENGKCPDHKTEPEVVEEENYFFEITNYKDELKEILESNQVNVFPEFRKNEALQFIDDLEDFSISRSQERAHGWGVEVPGDESHIMYVWFDALSNYINALDFAEDGEKFTNYWVQPNNETREVIHMLGKGVSRFHLVYWLGILLSADLPLPTEEFIHGYITVEGEKMSKSLGNVLNPHDLVDRFSTDSLRFYLLGAISPFEDGDFSKDRFKKFYNAHLANGVGNLTSRVLSMIEQYNDGTIPEKSEGKLLSNDINKYLDNYQKNLEQYQFDRVVEAINEAVSHCDNAISEYKPWQKHKEGEDINNELYEMVEFLRIIAVMLLPVIPQSASKILARLNIETDQIGNLSEEKEWGRAEPGVEIETGDPLFPRI